LNATILKGLCLGASVSIGGGGEPGLESPMKVDHGVAARLVLDMRTNITEEKKILRYDKKLGINGISSLY
jgi:hypothetical protein